MSQALHSAIESFNALSLEEKHQLWQVLESAILQQETNRNLDIATTKLSEGSFSKVWDNSEDAEYDNLN